MERVIDRREYRRNNEENKVITEEQVEVLQIKIRKFLIQLLGVSTILLIISFLKFYNCNEVLDKINKALDSEITISSLQKNGQIIFDEATNYYSKLNIFVDDILRGKQTFSFITNSSGENIIKNDQNSNTISQLDYCGEKLEVSGEIIINSGIISTLDNSPLDSEKTVDLKYESAVEGINQMSEDAKYIKENYKITIPVIGTITSRFGVRESNNPIVSSYHSGLDIAANTGTQVIAAIGGEVIEASTDTYFGKYIKIKKDDIEMIYAHCSKLLVKVGDKVERGKLIAYVGNTGNSTGPHLHFELRYKDRLVNPSDIFEI